MVKCGHCIYYFIVPISLLLRTSAQTYPYRIDQLRINEMYDTGMHIQCRVKDVATSAHVSTAVMVYTISRAGANTSFRSIPHVSETFDVRHLIAGQFYEVYVQAYPDLSALERREFFYEPKPVLNFSASLQRFEGTNFSDVMTFSYIIPPWSDYSGFTIHCRPNGSHGNVTFSKHYEHIIQGERNIALNKPVSMSSTASLSRPAYVTDGIYSASAGIAITLEDHPKWIKVDLQAIYVVSIVELYNYQRYCRSVHWTCIVNFSDFGISTSLTHTTQNACSRHSNYDWVHRHSAEYDIREWVELSVPVRARSLAVCSFTNPIVPLAIMEMKIYEKGKSIFGRKSVNVIPEEFPSGVGINCSIYSAAFIRTENRLFKPVQLQNDLLIEPFGPRVNVTSTSQLINGLASFEVTFEKIHESDMLPNLKLNVVQTTNNSTLHIQDTGIWMNISNLVHGGSYEIYYTVTATYGALTRTRSGPTFKLLVAPLKPQEMKVEEKVLGQLIVTITMEPENITRSDEVHMDSDGLMNVYRKENVPGMYIYFGQASPGEKYHLHSWTTMQLFGETIKSESNETNMFVPGPPSPLNFTYQVTSNNAYLFLWRVQEYLLQDGFVLDICTEERCQETISISYSGTNKYVEYLWEGLTSGQLNASLKATLNNATSVPIAGKPVTESFQLQKRPRVIGKRSGVSWFLILPIYSLVLLAAGLVGGYGVKRSYQVQVGKIAPIEPLDNASNGSAAGKQMRDSNPYLPAAKASSRRRKTAYSATKVSKRNRMRRSIRRSTRRSARFK